MNTINFPRLKLFKVAAIAAAAITITACGGEGGTAVKPVPTEMSLQQVVEALASGSLTSEEVVKAHSGVISEYEDTYNAFTFVNSDIVSQAQGIDEKRRSGQPMGPLAGVPVVIKETMDWQGAPSTAGWMRLSPATGGVGLYPAQNATVVQRLLDAGAVIVGKGNIPAFSDEGTRADSGWAGPTYNAIDRRFAAGASSSGVATAVAAGMATVGLGEETGGSIQNPAAAQSLVGVKPTFGLVPTDGVVPLAGSTRDVVGPIAKTVRDAAMVLTVVAGFSETDPKTAAAIGKIPSGGYAAQLSTTALAGKRVGMYGSGWRDLPLSPETQALYAKSMQEVGARGAITVADPFAGSGFAALSLPNEPYDYRGTESAAYDLNKYLAGLRVGKQGELLGSLAELSALIGHSPFEEGAPLNWYAKLLPVLQTSLSDPTTPPDLSEFNSLRDSYLQIFKDIMDKNQLDVLIFPHSANGLPLQAGSELFAETTVSAVDIAGLPLVTVPAGRYTNGSPFSLVFIGRQWSEASLLAMAYDYEQATRHRLLPSLKK